MGLCNLKKLGFFFCSTYIAVTVYAAYHLLMQKEAGIDGAAIPTLDRVHESQSINANVRKVEITKGNTLSTTQQQSHNHFTNRQVNIWSKAAIGSYFWEHLFEGLLDKQSEMYSYGEVIVDDILFRFFTGPGIVPRSMLTDTGNVVLVVNGREPKKIATATRWLDYVAQRQHQFNNVVVVMLGNERCNNSWLSPYMVTAGGPIKALFVTYDASEIDNQYVFQWPLGVATYRSFPLQPLMLHNISSQRRYRCNFLGTVYENSSRQTLLRVLNRSQLSGECYVKTRDNWLPQETAESMTHYVDVLRSSDLTLNAVGLNAECYRIYEAMACGSVPVIEDLATADACGTDVDSRRMILSLLKRYVAPVIYVSDWNQLPAILEREREMTPGQVATRRRKVVRWYARFRRTMRQLFVDVVRGKFFDEANGERQTIKLPRLQPLPIDFT